MKLNLPSFTINVASKPKREYKNKDKIISRKCYAVVILIDGELKAAVNYQTNEELILPFTEESLRLKDKEYVFLKKKDKYNHHVCIMRDNLTSSISPGIDDQYDVLHENLLIAGHIIRKNNKMYFEYEDLVKFNHLSDYIINDVRVDESKPLFNK